MTARLANTHRIAVIHRRKRPPGACVSICDYLPLSISEACFLCDALHGQLHVPPPDDPRVTLDLALFNALDFDQRDRAWGVNGQKVLAAAVGLSLAQSRAVLDAVRVLWEDPSLPISDRLTFVGLIANARAAAKPRSRV
jgi:hypothetical protein